MFNGPLILFAIGLLGSLLIPVPPGQPNILGALTGVAVIWALYRLVRRLLARRQAE